MPSCCGAISGNVTTVEVVYIPSVNVSSGTVTIYLSGFALSTGAGPLIQYSIPSALDIPVPEAQLFSLDPVLCHGTVCPQTAGQVYKQTSSFVPPTSGLTSAVITLLVA